jgi:hypothetical protein
MRYFIFLLLIVCIILFIELLFNNFNSNKQEMFMNAKQQIKFDTNAIHSVNMYPTYSIDPFFNSKFKPECCPSVYTSSSGCLCCDQDTFNLLYTRGGNAINIKNRPSFINTYYDK